MTRTHRAILASLVTVLAGTTTMTAAAAAAPWTRQPTVNPFTGSGDWNSFNAVTRPGTNDGWAGGYTSNYPSVRDQILIEHWNGTSWKVRAAPAVRGPDSQIRGMASTARNDVWAVGTTGDFIGGTTTQPFAMHSNGSAWTLVPTPGFPNAALLAVAARSPGNAWAAGQNDSGGLLEHWNGSAWSVSAGAPGSGGLNGVAFVPHGTVWAVGTSSDPITGAATTFAEHRVNGHWVRTPTPSPLDTDSDDVNELDSVAALSPKNAWAVGTVGNEDAGVPYRSFILHWNGAKWRRVPAQSPDPGGDPLFAVLARSADDVWAVGYGVEFGPKSHAIVRHWNGTRWSERAIHEGFLGSLAMNPANRQLWAAGYTDTSTHVNTLLEAHS